LFNNQHDEMVGTQAGFQRMAAEILAIVFFQFFVFALNFPNFF